jgi:hypothetical protein
VPSLAPLSLTIDGVSLGSYAYGITERTGWDSSPGLVGENVRVPGRDGVYWRAKDYDAGRMVLSMYVQGVGSGGSVPSGSTPEATFRANLDALLALFGKRHGLLTIDKGIEDGTIRRNYGEVTATIEPDYQGPDSFALLKVEITLPDPLWHSVAAVTIEPAGSASSPRTVALSALAGSTAPISDATVLVIGPATNPRITDTVSGAWIQLTGSIASGSVWRVRCADFVSESGASLGYTGGTASSQIASTTFSGPRLLPLTPDPVSLTPSLTLSGSGFTSATTLRISARRRFLS